MKKSNLLLSAAIAGLFATGAYAGDTKMPGNEKDCMADKMTWKDGKCSCSAKEEKMKKADKDANSCGSNGCSQTTEKK